MRRFAGRVAWLLFLCLSCAVAGAERRGGTPGWGAPASAASKPAAGREGIGAQPTLRDVAYGTDSSSQTLDVYQSKSKGLAPAVIYIHGGGWNGGSKTRLPQFLTRDVLGLGISIVSVEYRFTRIAPHPAQVNDCLRAVQFVRTKAKEWKIDPKRMATMGDSAGGHLALYVGLHGDVADPKAKDPVKRQSSRVSGVIDYYGPADFFLLRTIEHKHPAFKALLGVPPETAPSAIPDALLRDVSPISFASSDDPPILICQGTADPIVPTAHAERLYAKLREVQGAKRQSKLVMVEGAGHRFTPDQPPDHEAIAFLKEHLLNAR